jgi:hypothetical protein
MALKELIKSFLKSNGVIIKRYPEMDVARRRKLISENKINSIFGEGVAGHAYNVGSDQAISISDLAYLVRDILSPNKKVVFKNAKSGFMGRDIYI